MATTVGCDRYLNLGRLLGAQFCPKKNTSVLVTNVFIATSFHAVAKFSDNSYVKQKCIKHVDNGKPVPDAWYWYDALSLSVNKSSCR